mgnify:CR=1 FL=1
MKITVFMATSLDGFIADKDGKVDWLNDLAVDQDSNEDYGFQTLLSSVDRLVMGRNTFDQVLKFDTWGYAELPVTVISHRSTPTQLPKNAKITFLGGTPEVLMETFTKAGDKHIYLDGGDLVRQFLNAELITEIITTSVPVLLGDGISLFHQPLSDLEWHIKETKNYPNGFIRTHWIRI